MPWGQAVIRTLQEHFGAVLALAALGGGFLASGSKDTTVKIWHILRTPLRTPLLASWDTK